jgi:hypothetical protein
MSIKAMKQALDALEELMPTGAATLHLRENAITALRQAIAEAEKEATLQEISDIGQEIEQWDTSDMAHRSGGLSVEQEPVAWMNKDGWIGLYKQGDATIPLYTAPPKRPVKSYTGGYPQYATDDMSTKPENIDTSEERVHEIDILRQSEREGWRYAKECEAEIKRLKELAEYRLQLLMKMPEQADQEPVAWVSKPDFIEQQTVEGRSRRVWWECNTGVGIPFYTAPPKREWVGLTDEEIHKIIANCTPNNAAQVELSDFAKAISNAEAKLKEKNNG